MKATKRVGARKTSGVKAKRGKGILAKPVKKTTRKAAAKKPLLPKKNAGSRRLANATVGI